MKLFARQPPATWIQETLGLRPTEKPALSRAERKELKSEAASLFEECGGLGDEVHNCIKRLIDENDFSLARALQDHCARWCERNPQLARREIGRVRESTRSQGLALGERVRAIQKSVGPSSAVAAPVAGSTTSAPLPASPLDGLWKTFMADMARGGMTPSEQLARAAHIRASIPAGERLTALSETMLGMFEQEARYSLSAAAPLVAGPVASVPPAPPAPMSHEARMEGYERQLAATRDPAERGRLVQRIKGLRTIMECKAMVAEIEARKQETVESLLARIKATRDPGEKGRLTQHLAVMRAEQASAALLPSATDTVASLTAALSATTDPREKGILVTKLKALRNR